MKPEHHSIVSKRVREVLDTVRSEPVARIATELAKVVNLEYARGEAVAAAEHWKETFLNPELPANEKDSELDSCRARHTLWVKVTELKTPKF